MNLFVDEIVREPGAAANGGPSVSIDVPGKTEARLQIPPMFNQTRLPVEAGIARIGEAGRSVFVNRTHDALIEAIEAEVVDLPVFHLHREERLPTQAIVEREPRHDFPGVLRVEAHEPMAFNQTIGRGLP